MKSYSWLRRNLDLVAMTLIVVVAAFFSVVRNHVVPQFRTLEPVIVDVKPQLMEIKDHSNGALREVQEELRRARVEAAHEMRRHRDEMRNEAGRMRHEAHQMRDHMHHMRDKIRQMAHELRDEIRAMFRREVRI